MRPFLKSGFLDPAMCHRLRAAMDAGHADAAEIVGDAIATQQDVRQAMSIEIEPTLRLEVEARLDSERTILEEWFGHALGAREGTGLLRYHSGGFYLPHRDRGVVSGWTDAAHRAVAVVLFLNGDFDGGALRLYPEGHAPIDIQPAEGLLIAFPADVLHEVLAVVRGTRDVMVDWFTDERGRRGRRSDSPRRHGRNGDARR